MRLLLFAQLRDAAGCAEIVWPETGPLDARQLWQRLGAEFPALAAYRSVVRLARNCEYVGAEALFHDADEVALVPPVSGG